MYSVLRDLRFGGVAVNDRSAQITAAFLLDQTRAELAVMSSTPAPVSLASMLDQIALAAAGHGERRERGSRVLGRLRLDRAESLGQRLGDLLRVTRRPDARTIDAAAAAVEKMLSSHQVDVRFPVIHARRRRAESC